ncbi:hypothetical protein CSKR_100859, partial [Clonorchis sinensis]
TTTAAPTTTLPSFEEVVTVPTTPPPEPAYPLPVESLQDVRYTSTANHHWIFQKSADRPWIIDQAPHQNPLSRAVYERFRSFDRKLTQEGPIRDDIDNDEESIFTPLDGPTGTPKGIILQDALTPGSDRSISLTPDTADSQCVNLVENLQRERYYLKQCLLSAGACDYGLSLALWLQFLRTDATSKEIILATGPETARGFQLYLGAGDLHFDLWTQQAKWSIKAPFQKTYSEWINIGVSWGKSTQTLQLFVNRKMVAQKTNYLGEEYFGSNENATSLWLGCTVDGSGVQLPGSSTLGVKISTVTLWYWPLQLPKLFTGGLEMYLMELPTEPTTTVTPAPPADFYDYTYEVEELIPLAGRSYPPNPMYLVADLYVSMQDDLTQKEFAGIAWEPASERGLYQYRIADKNGYAKLHKFEPKGCPTVLDLCTDGLSFGVWMIIPTTLDVEQTALDILELVDGFRLTVFRQTLNLFAVFNRTVSAFRIVEVVPRDIWFNLGISIANQNAKMNVRAYFNGLEVHVLPVAAPPNRQQFKTEEFNQTLLIGSYAVDNSAVDVALNDLIFWYRSLADFESHRFVGYERVQLDQLQGSSYYWTPDLYIFRDSASQMKARRRYSYFTSVESISDTGVRGYALASLYKPREVNFRFSTTDYMGKSAVPIFDMQASQYMLLGRSKSPQHTSSDLLWTGQCLLDPSEGTCGLRGFAISFWIKLISVSEKRLRFYLNSGDPGTGGLTLIDNRGVAIFSDKTLFGVSLSQRFTSWRLLLDSTSYTLGQWTNVGILWREDVGLTLLLDGVNYGTTDVKGSKIYRARVAPPYVVLGRFNVDDKTAWVSPRDADAITEQSGDRLNPSWEMANFALGEVTYFNRMMTQEEYNTQIGLLGVARFRKFSGDLWFGKNLIDAPISQLVAATQAKIEKPGPVQSTNPFSAVNLLKQPDAVELINGTSLRLGVFDSTHCTRQEKFCPEGLSIGAWIRLSGLSVNNKAELIILFTGAGGKFGMAVSTTGEELGIWMSDELGDDDPTKSWVCTTRAANLEKATVNMQWIHYAFVWGPAPGMSEFLLRLIVNGKEYVVCSHGENIEGTSDWYKQAKGKAKTLYKETKTSESAYMLISSAISDSRVAVALVALKPATVVGSSLMDLIGVEYPQFLSMQIATFYWPFSGWMKQLSPSRLTPVRVQYAQDKQDTVMGAMCTDGTDQSFVAMRGDQVDSFGRNNLETACLINPTTCDSYVFIIDYYHPNVSFGLNASRELFRTAPLDAPENTVGLRITVSEDGQQLLVTARSELYTLTNSVSVNNLTQTSKWIELEVFYTATAIKIRNAGILLASNKDSVKKIEANRPLTSDERLNLRLTVGRGLPVCVSDVLTLDVPTGQDAEALISGGSATYCYPDVDYLEELKGTESDHLGLPKAAASLQKLVEPLLIEQAHCLYEPAACSSVTISLWARIDGVLDVKTGAVAAGDSEEVVAVLFSTGPPEKSGILVTLHGCRDGVDTKLDLRASVHTGSELWQVDCPQAITLGQWINIALQWYPSGETKSGGLEMYLNGLRQQSSTKPRGMVQNPVNKPDLARLYFTKAYVSLPDGEAKLKRYTLNGSVNHFAYWTSTSISCSRPRSTKQKIMGECSTDPAVSESVVCTVLRDCMQADGAVCMDPTLTNLGRMALQAEWLSDPADFQRLLTVALDVRDNAVSIAADNSTIPWVNEFVYYVNLILRAWPLALQRACDIRPSKNCNTLKEMGNQIIEKLILIIAAVTDPSFEGAWVDILSEGITHPSTLIKTTSEVLRSVTQEYESLDECEKEQKIVTKNGSAMIVVTNTDSSCPSRTLTLTTQSLLPENVLGSGSFEISSEVLRNGSQEKGLLSLIGIRAPSKDAKLVAGGLRRDRFAQHTFQGSSDGPLRGEPIRALRQKATELQIQSPVYLFNTNTQSEVSPLETANGSFILTFSVRLASQNEFQDVYFYRVTGRRKWKAVETVKQNELGQGENLRLAFPVRCVFWDSRMNNSDEAWWNDLGCVPTGANLTHVQCACTHYSAFAVAMEPSNAPGRQRSIWITWGISDEKQHEQVLKILLLSFNALSLACSIAFLVTVITYMVRSTFQDVYVIHTAMCVALIAFHSAWIAEPFIESSRIGCLAVSMTVHASAMLTASWTLCETVALFRCFVLGDFSCKRLWMWFLGLVTPTIIVVLPASLSQMENHGDDVLCFPGRESYVFWTMFGTIFAYLFISIVVCLVIGCNIETPAYLKPKLIEKLIQRASQLNFLTLFSAISWVAVVLALLLPIPYLPYAAFAGISLLGSLHFLFLDLGDVDLRKFYAGKYSDYSGAKNGKMNEKADLKIPGVVQHVFPEHYSTYDQEGFHSPRQSTDLEAGADISTYKRQLDFKTDY